MKKLCLLGLLALLTAASVHGNDFIYHGSFLWNDVRAIVQKDNYIFCAFHDGIGAVDLTRDFNKKKIYHRLEIVGKPLRLHLFDNILVSENEIGTVSIIDLTDPADMQLLGTFTPEWELFDLELFGDYLYAAVEYDGLVRYDLSDPGNIIFDDSSMAGIRVIALDSYDSRLYVLDDYNGVLIYEPTPGDIGLPISELLLPESGLSLTVENDTVYTGRGPTGYMVGSVSDVLNPVYLESRTTFIRANQISVTTDGVVVSNSYNGFELQYREGDSLNTQLFPLGNIRGYAGVFHFNDLWYISFPHDDLGFIVYEISNPELIALEYPAMIYAYPGPIRQIQFYKSRLHVVGTYNWYEIYDLSDPGNPVREAKIINPPYKPGGVCAKGDTLFITDIETNGIFPAVDNGVGDPIQIYPFFTVIDSVGRPNIIPDYFGDRDLIYFHNGWTCNGSARNDTLTEANLFRWSFVHGVTSLLIDDSILYYTDRKKFMNILTIDENNFLTEVTRRDLPSRNNQILKIDTLLYLAAGNLIIAEMSDPLAPNLIYTAYEPVLVYEIQKVDSWLACAAANGLFIYDISGNLPQLLFNGGDPARYVTYDNHRLVASDGRSIKVYTVPIVDTDDNQPALPNIRNAALTGYPNPFNPSITLILENFFSPIRDIRLDVYDILGRKIRRLDVSMTQLSRGEARWDGRDEKGNAVASGVYLFKAATSTEQAVFKAILVK